MKSLLTFVGVVVAIFVIWALWSERKEPPPATPAVATPVGARPFASVPATTPAPAPTPPSAGDFTAARARGPASNVARSGEVSANPAADDVMRVIKQCAARSQWRILEIRPSGVGMIRVTGVGDNPRGQRFLTELEDSHVMKGFDQEGKFQEMPVPGQPPWMKATYLIRY